MYLLYLSYWNPLNLKKKKSNEQLYYKSMSIVGVELDAKTEIRKNANTDAA